VGHPLLYLGAQEEIIAVMVKIHTINKIILFIETNNSINNAICITDSKIVIGIKMMPPVFQIV